MLRKVPSRRDSVAGGVTEPGAIAGHPALETARAMGAAIA